MSEVEPSAVFREALAQIERISQLSDGLALIILAGPATHARETLERIATMLKPEREVFWHPLDSRGALLIESLASTARQPALLVHGLEWLADEEREEVETALNLSRDTLVASRALIVFWVDLRLLDEFRWRCPDLFHWRSLLLTLSEQDLPLPAAIVELRRYAHFLYKARPLPLDFYFEPLVRVEGEIETMPLSAWAARVTHGCLEGDPGSGKSIGVEMYAAGQAQQASEQGGLVPLLIAARALEAPKKETGLALVLPPTKGFHSEDRLSAEVLERWAKDGQLQIVVDGFDEIPAPDRNAWLAWLYRLRQTYPRLRTLLVTRPRIMMSEGWERAEVQAWDSERIEAFLLKSFPFERIYSREQAREMARSPIALPIFLDLYRQTGALLTDRSALLRAYTDKLLGSWDAVRNLSRHRSTTSPQTLRRQLAKLALELLERGTDVFHLEDLKNWAEPQEELRYLVERTGLIQEVSEGRYAFSHRSLFEHFATEGLVDLGAREALGVMLEHRGDPLWKDVLVLAAERLLSLVDEPGSAMRERLTGLLAELGEHS